MTLPGFFLEYLVTGSCALFWLFGLSRLFNATIPVELSAPQVALFAPALYVVGMLIDFCSRQPLMAFQDYLEGKKWLKKVDSDGDDSQAAIWVQSTELGKQTEIRSSRDRVARGAVGNLLAATIVFTGLTARSYSAIPWHLVLIAGFVLTGIAVRMWLRFDYLTSKFKHKACEALTKSRANKVA
jgi:hypothetical protein